MERNAGIYIHIPFCRRHCFYCHFTTLPHDPISVKPYIKAVVDEIGLRSSSRDSIDSIYVGGGSPSLLGEAEISPIVEAIIREYRMAPDPEISIECNPEDLTREKLQILKRAGFNRLSVGVQSFEKKDLVFLERNHSVQSSLDAVSDALEVSFSNINIDYIIGFPGQDKRTIDANLSEAGRLGVPHISGYLLEQSTKPAASEIQQLELFDLFRKGMISMGFEHYEISNYCQPGFECRHNLKYWQNQEYIGIGLAASGFQDQRDYRNEADLGNYLDKINRGNLPVGEVQAFAPHTRKIITGLRCLSGLPEGDFEWFPEELGLLLAEKLLIRRNGRIAVNPQKILLLNEILAYFI